MEFENTTIVLRYKTRALQSIICLSFLFSNAICQWSKVPDFSGICNDAILVDSANIWGVCNLGTLFNYDLIIQDFEYRYLDENVDFHSLFPANDSTIYLGGRNYNVGNGVFVSYRVDIDSIEFSVNTTNTVKDILFLSRDTGIYTGFLGIYRTIDGGKSWTLIWDFESYGAQFGMLNSLTADSHGGIYVAGTKRQNLEESNRQGFILKSSDQGLSWNSIFEVHESELDGIEFRHGGLYCHDKERMSLYSSLDFGQTWQTIDIPVHNPMLRISDLTYLSQEKIIACISQEFFFASNGADYSTDMLVSSTDNGVIWQLQFLNQPQYPPRDSSLNTIVNVNDTILYSFGWHRAIMTENSGGENNPVLNTERFPQLHTARIYPVPASNVLFVEGLSNEYRYSINTISGEFVVSDEICHSKRQVIPITELDPGIYIISFTSYSRTIHTQFFIKL